MLEESDANRLWKQLFRSKTVTTETLREAEAVVNQIKPESPLRLRFATELEEIRSLYWKTNQKEQQ